MNNAPTTAPPVESLRQMSRHSLVIIAVIAVFIAFKLLAHVLAPLVLAIFLIIIAWPIKTWLDQHLPKSLSYAGSLIALSFVVIALLGSVWLSAAEISEHGAVYQQAFGSFLTQAKQELSQQGVDTRGGKLTLAEVRTFFFTMAGDIKEIVIIICVMLSYVILAIPEAARWKNKLGKCFGRENSQKILATTAELSRSFQAYISATVIGGLINALFTTVTAFALGLDFPVTWGVVILLLNFIPTLGPSLIPFLMAGFAFIQFDSGSMMPYVVLATVSALQLVFGMLVEPRLQGNMLQLSPVVVLFSLTFWAFLWGLPGALLATPLTQCLIIACGHFPQTNWIACMLSESRRPATA
jgi:predicted PurR-regulated permease PerM